MTKLSTVVLAYDEYEVSPYEELQLNLVRNIEMSRMASIMAGTALITNIYKFATQIAVCHDFYFLIYLAMFSS